LLDTLLTVINDILDYSRLEAGKMKLFSVPLNLKDTIVEVVRALSYTNLERGLETFEDLELDPTMLVMGDPVRLHQIFMNLLSNSYKFTHKGSVTVKSRVEYEDDQRIRVRSSVADSGIGISQEQVTRLFTPFSQADNSTQRSYGGSGLGLSICKSLIDFLGGRIWLESQVGFGTTVSFVLSFEKAAKGASVTEAERSAKEPDPMATWSSDGDGMSLSVPIKAYFHDLTEIPRDQLRICIAEDNPINQKIAVSFVTRLGIQCEAFSDGLQAVESLRRQSSAGREFHIVLMDVQMPVLDGYDATRLIRKDADPSVRGVIIIAMTASAIRGDREKCIEAGMNNYLAKPVRSAVLQSMLDSYLTKPVKLGMDLPHGAMSTPGLDSNPVPMHQQLHHADGGDSTAGILDTRPDPVVSNGSISQNPSNRDGEGNGQCPRPSYFRRASSNDSTITIMQTSHLSRSGDMKSTTGSADKAK
jgi:CheY-like chemotaxis protein